MFVRKNAPTWNQSLNATAPVCALCGSYSEAHSSFILVVAGRPVRRLAGLEDRL